MPEIHLRQPGFNYSFANHLLKTKIEFENIKKQEKRFKMCLSKRTRQCLFSA